MKYAKFSVKPAHGLLAVAAGLSLSIPAFALDNIVHQYQSVRSAGMGNLKTTTGLYDENFFGNPARNTANSAWKISLADVMVETNSDSISVGQDLASGGDDILAKIGDATGKNVHARVQTSFPSVYLPNFWGGKMSYAVGVFMSTQVDVAPRKSYSVDPTVIVDAGPALSVARKFLEDDKLSVGMTAHASYRMATEADFSFIDLLTGKSLSPAQSGADGMALDFDLGATYVLPFKIWDDLEFTTGASINNALGGDFSTLDVGGISNDSGDPENPRVPKNQPRSLSYGISARKPSFLFLKDTLVAFEFQDWGNNKNGSIFRTVHMGAETRVLSVLIPRVGVSQGYWSAGLGLDLRILQIDAASYGEEMSTNAGYYEDRRYALRIAIQI